MSPLSPLPPPPPILAATAVPSMRAPACFAHPLPHRYATPRLPHVTRSRRRPSRAHTPTRMTSLHTPDSFNTHWYRENATPFDIDLAAHHILSPSQPAQPTVSATDAHFVDGGRRVMALVDHPRARAPQLLADLRDALVPRAPLYGHEARLDLHRALSTALRHHGAPPGFSALAMDCSSHIMRVAWAGSCGFVLVRNDRIVYRSYGGKGAREALEDVLLGPCGEDAEAGKRRQWPAWAGDVSATGGYSYMVGVGGEGVPMDGDAVHAEFLELEDNDLLIAGSDGFFANVSEEQLLAFVRPVPDAEDKTLAIANHTCLGSWRWDDVDFISYYLSFIALNFATAEKAGSHLPSSFPPSPHADDITVMCAACSFQK